MDKIGSENIDREKMWISFHQMRSLESFQHKWKVFLESNNMLNEPLFYQHITIQVFETLVKQQQQLKIDIAFEDEQAQPVEKLTYEEENALRYIGGYILRTLSTKNPSLVDAINELKGADSEPPEESEEWTGSIDRGGLIYTTSATHQLLSAIEYTLRKYLNTGNAHLMDNKFRSTLTTTILEDDDVQFHFVIATASIDEEEAKQILEKAVSLYITIRGYSFASSVLEMYKQKEKKGTQKKKSLRQSIQ